MARRIGAARAEPGLAGLQAPIATLSGGTKQRIALASILALQPRALVLDEPTANLDPAGAHEVLLAVARLVADRERSVLLIEHRLDDILSLIDRVVVLDADGRLALSGTPRAVFVDAMDRLASLGVWVPQLRRPPALLRRHSPPLDAAEAAAVVVQRWPPTSRVPPAPAPAGAVIVRPPPPARPHPPTPLP